MTTPTSSTTLVAVPAAAWGGTAPPHLAPLVPLFRDLGVCDRRLPKRVDVAGERERMASVQATARATVLSLEAAVRNGREFTDVLQRNRLPAVTVGAGYFDLVQEWHRRGEAVGLEAAGRLGSAVVPPIVLADHRRAFEAAAYQLAMNRDPAVRARAVFLGWAAAAGCGLIERTDPFAGVSGVRRDDGRLAPTLPPWFAFWHRVWVKRPPAVAARKASGPADWELYDSNRDDPKAQITQRLTRNIERAMEAGDPVPITNVRHEDITRVFHRFVVGGRAAAVRVLYADGSEARPFRFGRLGRADPWSPTRVLHVGLISVRHFEIDPQADEYWFRNAEVPSKVSQAEADEWCYQATVSRLAALKLAYPGERLEVRLYHTGLESAVIGFYRAVVDELIAARGPRRWLRRPPADWLRVVPIFAKDAAGENAGPRWPE
jgi:hypothetical protein